MLERIIKLQKVWWIESKEYIFISPNSKEADIQQSWNVLPSAVKNRIKNRDKRNVLKEAKKKEVLKLEKIKRRVCGNTRCKK